MHNVKPATFTILKQTVLVFYISLEITECKDNTIMFYKSKSIYDRIAMYAVFGGSPYVNRALDETKSLKENIIAFTSLAMA